MQQLKCQGCKKYLEPSLSILAIIFCVVILHLVSGNYVLKSHSSDQSVTSVRDVSGHLVTPVTEMVHGHRRHTVTTPADVDTPHPAHYLSHVTAEDRGPRFS